MKISVFGLGYVGAVSAGCLARSGHGIIGVDANPAKVDLINAGQSPIVERDIGAIIASAVGEGALRATASPAEALAETELSLVCVGTPSDAGGDLDLTHVRRVCEQIGEALAGKPDYHVVAVRSTILPGSMAAVVIPALETRSGKRAGEDFGVCFNPEFMRESTAVHDFYHPPKTVIGETGSRAGDVLAGIYREIDAPLVRTDLQTAEMVKYIDNCWHALKVCFANEIGNLCKALGVDSHAAMDIFCRDTKLNLSASYLKPGFAFGGSCLPKDVRALVNRAASLRVDAPVLDAILPSNRLQLERGLDLVLACPGKRVGVLGLSFKAGTDDLRESPLVELIERLVGKGFDVRIYDGSVRVASLLGTNRDYILQHLPHLARLLVESIDELVEHAETIIIGNAAPEFRDVPGVLPAGKHVVDLVRIDPDAAASCAATYAGICW